MKTLTPLSIALALALVATAAHSQSDRSNLWPTMHAGLEALINLQPYVAVPSRFDDPNNRAEIQKNLDVLAGMKHAFPTGAEAAKSEPGFAAISGLFSSYVSEVATAFRHGESRPYIRNHVRTITGLCLNCHTRVPTHTSFEDLRSKTVITELTPFQRFEFFTATRQYDKALAEFDNVLTSLKKTDFGYGDFPAAVHEALTIAVRVKHDPALTNALLVKISALPELPDFYARYLSQWKLDTAEWARETFDPAKATVAQLVNKARKLVLQGEAEQYYAVDLVGDVVFLRATRYLHEALDRNPEASSRHEALYLLGRSYAALQDPFHWGMDKLYLEACVRETPHTKLARQCYGKYVGTLATASQQTLSMLLPKSQIDKLKELRKLAH